MISQGQIRSFWEELHIGHKPLLIKGQILGAVLCQCSVTAVHNHIDYTDRTTSSQIISCRGAHYSFECRNHNNTCHFKKKDFRKVCRTSNVSCSLRLTLNLMKAHLGEGGGVSPPAAMLGTTTTTTQPAMHPTRPSHSNRHRGGGVSIAQVASVHVYPCFCLRTTPQRCHCSLRFRVFCPSVVEVRVKTPTVSLASCQ